MMMKAGQEGKRGGENSHLFMEKWKWRSLLELTTFGEEREKLR